MELAHNDLARLICSNSAKKAAQAPRFLQQYPIGIGPDKLLLQRESTIELSMAVCRKHGLHWRSAPIEFDIEAPLMRWIPSVLLPSGARERLILFPAKLENWLSLSSNRAKSSPAWCAAAVQVCPGWRI
jgi:hypothetical protein